MPTTTPAAIVAADDAPIHPDTKGFYSKPNSQDWDNDAAVDLQLATQHGGSRADARDMLRMGKKQEFKRNFSFLSALGFVSIYMATWEFVLVSLSVGFANGGFAGLFWCFITTIVCYATIVASLAEMESMAPTAGGEYPSLFLIIILVAHHICEGADIERS